MFNYQEFAQHYLIEIKNKFPQAELRNLSDLKALLQQYVPKIVHRLIGARSIKNCGGVSRDFAELASQLGFVAIIHSLPGHFRNIVLLKDSAYAVDLTHAQFNLKLEPSKIENGKVSPEEKLEINNNYKYLYNNPFKAIEINKLQESELLNIFPNISLPSKEYDNINPDPKNILDNYDISEEEEIFPERFQKFKQAKMSKKRVDQDVRPELFFRNYDYGGPEDGGGSGPGTGLYHGDMSKYKSVKEFIERSRKRRAERRKKAWAELSKKYNINV